jgi:hypothetical protein
MRYALVTLLVALTGSAAGSVTLDVGQYFNANRVRVLVFTGTISSRAGGEIVEVLGRDCGASGEHLVAGTRTSTGGSFRAENPSQEQGVGVWNLTPVYSGTTFRARWDGEYSRPVEWRLPAQPQFARVSGTRTWVVHVVPDGPTALVGFQGKTVVLQRLSAGGWVRVRSARLVRKASLRWGAFNFQASFTVPARGLTLRAYLPAASAAPCYLPGSSLAWRS